MKGLIGQTGKPILIKLNCKTKRFSGFFWEAGMLSAEELCVLASWDDAQLSLEEVEGYVDNLNKIIQWITQPENSVKPVGQVMEYK